MKMTQIKVTKENVVEVAMDKSNYVIRKLTLFDEFAMQPANRISVTDLLSEDNIVIKLED